MTDLPRTARFALPLLAVAQAQKEMTHNEALTLIDALVQTEVEDGPLVSPPVDPDEGQCWIVGESASGAWAGMDAALAISTAGAWRFVVPREGMRATRVTDGASMRFSGGEWIEPAAVAIAAGGSVVDSEARAAIAALILHLEAQGLLIAG